MAPIEQSEYVWNRQDVERWLQAQSGQLIIEQDALQVPNESLFWIRRSPAAGQKIGLSVEFSPKDDVREPVRIIMDWPSRSGELTILAAELRESLEKSGARPL